MTSHYGALILPSSVPALRREEVACMTNTTDLLSTNYFPPSRCVLGPRVSFAGSSRREPVRPERTGGILYFSSSSPPLRPRIISFPTHHQNTSALESREGGGGEGGTFNPRDNAPRFLSRLKCAPCSVSCRSCFPFSLFIQKGFSYVAVAHYVKTKRRRHRCLFSFPFFCVISEDVRRHLTSVCWYREADFSPFHFR